MIPIIADEVYEYAVSIIINYTFITEKKVLHNNQQTNGSRMFFCQK